jgi:hypothetical protein
MNTRTESGVTIEIDARKTTFKHDSAVEDLLTAKTAQLRALLYLFSGEERETLDHMHADLQSDLGWLAHDLAKDVHLMACAMSSRT